LDRKTRGGVFLLVAGAFFVLTLGTAILTGCGGGKGDSSPAGTHAANGRAALTVRWPPRSRLIPFASESIKVSLSRGSALLGQALLVRPADGGQATAHFDR
jgi:hypothetical protein